MLTDYSICFLIKSYEEGKKITFLSKITVEVHFKIDRYVNNIAWRRSKKYVEQTSDGVIFWGRDLAIEQFLEQLKLIRCLCNTTSKEKIMSSNTKNKLNRMFTKLLSKILEKKCLDVKKAETNNIRVSVFIINRKIWNLN